VAPARLLADRVGPLAQGPVLREVAEIAPHLLPVSIQVRRVALELSLERDNASVGQELRERRVQQVVRLLARVVAHQVDRHVVRRSER
jgi:hypothetical protein